ncbi:MAG: hypothetical protein PHH83_00800 [Patescibacteria group bacterium]|nr:hypothetical protein [Patescibacteria group bacterium]
MKTKKILFSVGLLSVLGIMGLVLTNSALAYRGDYTKNGPNHTPERQEAMEKAFENNDYASWKNLMQGRGRVTQVVNQSNFFKFAQAHDLAQQGKYEEADKIRQELGLRTRNGEKVGAGYGREESGKGQRMGR